ncbi:MAG: response regulator [Candidatus Electrothrix sp. AR3]|nr:response regulator [Candidatus Electrothrix sp. AR3]
MGVFGGGVKHGIKSGEYAVLKVQDTGPGISEVDLEQIFEPFYTKKVMGRSGTGLGLTVVWNTMQDHNGKIFIESNEEGTSFWLFFLISRERRQKIFSEKNEQKAAVTDGSGSVLIVDDEPHLRDIASRMLHTMGYTVASVSSGELAVEYIHEKPADLVVIDMLMEPGMNGRQTHEELLKLYPDQKVLIASGFAENCEVEAALKRGACGFIKKPYSMEQLGRAVKNALTSNC